LEADEGAALAVDGVAPRFVAAPRSPEEAARLLREAADQGWAVVPRGSGTKTELGNPPRALDLVLQTHGLSGLADYTPADMTVTVGAGMRLADLQAALAPHGQMLALDPPYAAEATLGGILAADDSGPHRLGYGTARDLVIGTRVAMVDGRVTRAGGKVVKNVTGYDLNKLYIGSLGTLAVLVEVSFKLHPLPHHARTVWASFPTATAALDAVLRLARSPLRPVALMLNDLRGSEMAEGHHAPLRLHVEFTGTPAAVARKTADAVSYCREAGAAAVAILDEGGAAAWVGMREHPTAFSSPDGVRLKVTVPPTSVGEILDVASHRAAVAELRYWGLSYAASGVAYIYLDSGTPAPYVAITQELRARAGAAGGALVVQSCPTALKGLVDVWGAPPESLSVMQALKATYDPGRHLNPGRFVGGL
jgi:glycolate oxidase FAD binding subunit